MKIAVICKDHNDFLNHKKSSENEYWEFYVMFMVCGGGFDSIEITNKGTKLKDLDSILTSIRLRMKINEWASFPTYSVIQDKYNKQIFGLNQDVRRKLTNELIDEMNKFREQLNSLKNKTMKITEDTKIKDLIPDGYELNESMITRFNYEGCDNGITLPFSKKKEVKDFKWYCDKYFDAKYYESPSGRSILISSKNSVGVDTMIRGDYNSIPFEIKIGLLKFICDDLKEDLVMNLVLIQQKLENGRLNDLNVSKICPKEFLESIFS